MKPVKPKSLQKSHAPTRGGWKKGFLAAYRLIGVVTQAAQKAGVRPETVFRAMQRSEAFSDQVRKASLEATDYLEAVAISRATSGPKPSDMLLMFLLKSRDRPRFGDSNNYKLEHAGDPAKPILVESKGTILILPAKEMDAAIIEHSPIPLLEEHNGEAEANGGANGNGSEIEPV